MCAYTQGLKSFLSTLPPGKVRQALPKNVNLLENIKDFPNEAAFSPALFTREVTLLYLPQSGLHACLMHIPLGRIE